jgi:hypothetical protein
VARDVPLNVTKARIKIAVRSPHPAHWTINLKKSAWYVTKSGRAMA